ncbi:MAG: serine/threonine protein kinase [Prosthecobacter sp.]|jgi:serine/threonine protein kinase|uniref:serine/threonine-protein kinase n=1 Tax=Prosthecobacter sp. TaxID=1965333 RepID=UPI0019E2EC07|nr:serine/threonine-protein kinase [Prosthecobacter sp.]MBE2284623.1 serine/threonine protein kinase [Prosthecobacter sp.]
MSSPPDISPSQAGSWQPPSVAELQRMMPQFAVESFLGRGGMGAVYKGVQVSLDRPVAIKLLPAELARDEEFMARFQREARTLAALQHPGIISVYEFGQTKAGHLYFAMEYVDGSDLSRHIHQQGLTAPQTLDLIIQVCGALQYAHAQGVIHRDIKPANVLVTLDGRAKLADFGLARPLKQDMGLTASNVVMGTPDYIAPECWMGQLDHRSDLYSLGVMLYEMLTRETPRGAWLPPSLMAQVDARIDQIVVKALQRQPENRYQAASEMGDAVDVVRRTPPQAGQTRPQPASVMASSHRAPLPPRSQLLSTRRKSPTNSVLAITAMLLFAFLAWVLVQGPKKNSSAVSTPQTIPKPDAAIIISPKPEPVTPTVPPAPVTPPVTPMPVAPVAGTPKVQASASPPAPSPIPAPPSELDTLTKQMAALIQDRVTQPFGNELSVLNSGYLRALDRERSLLAANKKLEDALLVEEEKKRISQGDKLPLHDANIPSSIIPLRTTYRKTHSEIEKRRITTLQGLYAAYINRLKLLEDELTKKGLLDEAKETRDHRVRQEQEAETVRLPTTVEEMQQRLMASIVRITQDEDGREHIGLVTSDGVVTVMPGSFNSVRLADLDKKPLGVGDVETRNPFPFCWVKAPALKLPSAPFVPKKKASRKRQQVMVAIDEEGRFYYETGVINEQGRYEGARNFRPRAGGVVGIGFAFNEEGQCVGYVMRSDNDVMPQVWPFEKR